MAAVFRMALPVTGRRAIEGYRAFVGRLHLGLAPTTPAAAWHPRLRRYASFHDAQIVAAAARSENPVPAVRYVVAQSNSDVVDAKALLRSARFLHDTLPVRLARRIVDIHHLPYICGINPHIQTIHDLYMEAFYTIRDFPPINTLEEEAEFHATLREQLGHSMRLLKTLARAGKEISPYMSQEGLRDFLNSFISSRIGRRILADQYSALRERFHSNTGQQEGKIGFIVSDCNPREHGQRAYQIAAELCRARYGDAPGLVMTGPSASGFNYLPRHIDYMLLELFKNAARAVMERTQAEGGKILPPVELSIFTNDDETSFKITDKGVGIPNALQSRVWDYAFTTSRATVSVPDSLFMAEHDLTVRPLGGEGFGLPMVRVYANYFGGDVSLTSYPNHMTEVRLICKHLDNQEALVKAFGRSL